MPDPGERTAAEREAARLQREQRRAQRDDGSVSDNPPLHGSEGLVTSDDEREIPESHGDADDAEFDEFHEFDAGEELPSGTRRISHYERAAKRGGARRSVKPRPRVVRRRVRPPTSARHRWIGRVASLLALAVAAALAWFLVELFQPFHGSPHGRVTVVVPPHASSSQIGDLLAKKGVVSSGFFFELRATLAGERGKLRAGVYHLQLGMTYGAVLSELTKPPRAAAVTDVTITEGRNRHQINALLRAQHVHGSYLAATRSSRLLKYSQYGVHKKPGTLEGFLFPDTYQLIKPISIPALVTDQLHAFKQEFAKVNFAHARRRHLSPYDVLIIASLIEGEAATKRDRPLVASVIYNRLADHMPLQLDATTRFATGNYTRPLTVSQLHSRSAYNTRTHVGLPPGPINNPGMAAIQAAAHPARTRYLYFFTRPCGRSAVFATNYSQFLAQGSQKVKKHC